MKTFRLARNFLSISEYDHVINIYIYIHKNELYHHQHDRRPTQSKIS